MKKVLIVCAAMVTTVVLTPAAFAAPLTLNQIGSPYVLTSENAADVGPDVSIVNAIITNNLATQSIAITGIEYYLGGDFVVGANGDTPSQFTSAGNGWTYSLGEGNYSDSTGTAWSKNLGPTAGDAVKPRPTSDSLLDYLSAVTLENSSSSGYCYNDEILTAGSSCDVEFLVTAHYGGPMGSSSDTFIYGYAEGVAGLGSFNTNTEAWSRGTNTLEANGMQEQVEIDVSPEPTPLVLLGTGFGLLGLGVFLRRRHAASHPTTA